MKVTEVPIAELARQYYNENRRGALFALVAKSWPPVGEELPTGGVGEACRFAFIRARQQGTIDRHLWEARTLTAAVVEGARETAAGLLLPHFIAATEMALQGVKAVDGGGHEQARAILDEMKRLVREDHPAWARLLGRLYHEKRGFSFLMEARSAEAGGRPTTDILQSAEKEYLKALEYLKAFDEPTGDERTSDERTSDPRGVLKVRGGLALVCYLRCVGTASKETSAWLAETQRIQAAAERAGFSDVARWAAGNVEVMERGDTSGWFPYEVV